MNGKNTEMNALRKGEKTQNQKLPQTNVSFIYHPPNVCESLLYAAFKIHWLVAFRKRKELDAELEVKQGIKES